jgi:urease accessory protein
MPIMKRLSQLATTLSLLAASTSVLAHPGHGGYGLAAGLAHPFTGLDHLLAMFAVGLWAAQDHPQRRAIWALPAAFMLALVAGAALGMSGLALPWVEQGISGSVLALGLLLALAVRVPAALSVGVTALFGAAHGYAHGAEMPPSASPLWYGAGFLLATGLLHGIGVLAGLTVRQRAAVTLAGTALSLAGAGMLLGLA